MRVVRLTLANVRRIKAAEFCFQPGFNLIVGINGVGKTTVLDALAVCLSDVVGHVNKLQKYRKLFSSDDIRIGTDALDIFCDVEDMKGVRYSNVFHRSRKTIEPRKKVRGTSEWAGFAEDTPPFATDNEPERHPLAVLFSANRSNQFERLSAWIRSRWTLNAECTEDRRALEVINNAVTRFLSGYGNLRPDEHGKSLLIDLDGTTLPVKLLSGGERSMLAMVLDLTRRLAQANPEVEDPAAEASAIVLIDDIELHLHPVWQRRIVANLTRTFPKCQFIATTHSPQVIGEVEHERIQIIAEDQVYSPLYSYGVDSSRVLEEIMGTDPRTKDVKALLSKISRTIRDEQYDDAHVLLAELSRQLGENDPEVTRVRILLDFMAGDP